MTIEAVDGQDAIEKFELHHDIDLSILDSVMPRKNGREAFEKIRAINPRIKVLFISGYTRDIVLDKGIKDREFDFIPKPLMLDRFLQKIREILDREENG
jgi:CheY-like chemotaxis protein